MTDNKNPFPPHDVTDEEVETMRQGISINQTGHLAVFALEGLVSNQLGDAAGEMEDALSLARQGRSDYGAQLKFIEERAADVATMVRAHRLLYNIT